MYCDEPTIDNGSYNVTKSYLSDRFVRYTQITYACRDGYKSTSEINILTCDITWLPADVRCIPGKSCC